MGKSLNQHPKGFTLIELIIYLGITTAALLVFTSFMVDVTKNATRAQTATEIQRNARIALSRITQEIRTAHAVHVNSAHHITLTSSNDETIQMYLVNEDIAYTIDGGPIQILTNDNVRVTDLIFEQDDNSVSIALTLEQKNENAQGANKHGVSLSSTVTPRRCIYSRSLCP